MFARSSILIFFECFCCLEFFLRLKKTCTCLKKQHRFRVLTQPCPELSNARIHIDTDRGRLQVAWGAQITYCNRGTPKRCKVLHPPKINISPKKGNHFKRTFHLPTIDFQDLLLLVFEGVYVFSSQPLAGHSFAHTWRKDAHSAKGQQSMEKTAHLKMQQWLIQHHLFSSFNRVHNWKRVCLCFFSRIQPRLSSMENCLIENISRGRSERSNCSNSVYWPITSALHWLSSPWQSKVIKLDNVFSTMFVTPSDNSIESLKMDSSPIFSLRKISLDLSFAQRLYFAHRINSPESWSCFLFGKEYSPTALHLPKSDPTNFSRRKPIFFGGNSRDTRRRRGYGLVDIIESE